MYNLFISHSWTYSDAYDRLVDLLDNASYFSYRNYSVPKDNPILLLPIQADRKLMELPDRELPDIMAIA